MLFLKDTDGDDKADQVIHLMDGWASDDTHHTCGAFEWNNGGLLHMLEGIATSTTLETPWGPHRSKGDGGAYVMDPRTLKIRQFALPGQYNMWCYVFNDWGPRDRRRWNDRQSRLGYPAFWCPIPWPPRFEFRIQQRGDAPSAWMRVSRQPKLPR